MKLSFLLLIVLTLSGLSFAGDKDFDLALESALAIHDTASSFASEKIALKAFENVCKKYDDEWLGHYWTAYLYTQVGRLVQRTSQDEEPMPYIDKAQKHLDKAAELLVNKTAEQESDIYALQILVYNFRGWFNEAESEKYKAKAKEAFKKAVQANSHNPLLYVMSGTNLVSEGQKENDFRKIYAGKILLETAQKKFSETKIARSQTTHWNSEWLPFWIPHAEKLLAGES